MDFSSHRAAFYSLTHSHSYSPSHKHRYKHKYNKITLIFLFHSHYQTSIHPSIQPNLIQYNPIYARQNRRSIFKNKKKATLRIYAWNKYTHTLSLSLSLSFFLDLNILSSGEGEGVEGGKRASRESRVK